MEQIVVQPQAVGFCRFHQRVDDCTRFRALGRIGKEPSLSANDKRTDGVFYLVVADFNLPMLKKSTRYCQVLDLLTKYPEAWFLWYNGGKGGVTYDGTAKWSNEYDHS